MHAETVIVILFAVATGVDLLVRWLKVPYTVALVVTGLVLSALLFPAVSGVAIALTGAAGPRHARAALHARLPALPRLGLRGPDQRHRSHRGRGAVQEPRRAPAPGPRVDHLQTGGDGRLVDL